MGAICIYVCMSVKCMNLNVYASFWIWADVGLCKYNADTGNAGVEEHE